MNAALDILTRLESEGVSIQPNGANIKWTAKQPAPDDLNGLLASVKQHKPEILETLERLHGIPLSELIERAGEDWSEIEQDPELLGAFAHACMCTSMRLEGRVPPNYTATTNCEQCGPVFTFPGGPKNLLGCPWCFNRLNNLPIPRPN